MNGTEGCEHLSMDRVNGESLTTHELGGTHEMNDQSALLAALQRDISDRLRPVCSGLSEASFQELVREIAMVKLKYGMDGELSPAVKRQLEELVSDSPSVNSDQTGQSN